MDGTGTPDGTRGDGGTLLGGSMSILRMAELLDKNVDEIVCGVSKRVPKLYAEGETAVF